jgi:hypothetical protein
VNVRTFWVNQGQTFAEERRARVLWAPKLSRPRAGGVAGTTRAHWERLMEASPGDIVFHYAGRAVRAWSSVLEPAFDGPPPFEDPTTRWSADGRVLRVQIEDLDRPIELDDIPHGLRTEQDSTAWPFSKRGAVKQVYLSEVWAGVAEWLLAEVGLRTDAAQLAHWPEERAVSTSIDYRGDRQVVSRVRGEQAQLRRHLFGDELIASCALCGRELPVALLVAAHVKRRADTSHAERGRTDIVMPACLVACDSLFELGYVIVARGGQIETGPRRLPMTEDLARTIESIVGRTCSAWDPSTERYFEHHRRFQKSQARRFGLD